MCPASLANDPNDFVAVGSITAKNAESLLNAEYFDISQDGREVVLERVQERSDVVLLDLPPD